MQCAPQGFSVALMVGFGGLCQKQSPRFYMFVHGYKSVMNTLLANMDEHFVLDWPDFLVILILVLVGIAVMRNR